MYIPGRYRTVQNGFTGTGTVTGPLAAVSACGLFVRSLSVSTAAGKNSVSKKLGMIRRRIIVKLR